MKREILGETPSYLSDATPIAQEQIVYNDTIPAVSQQEMHYSRKVSVSASTRAGHISHEIDRAEEPLYAPRTGPEQAEAMADYSPRALEQGASREGFSADAESLVSSPESTPRSTASTPRNASRPATPRERVQHQIMLSQQKRRMRRQVCSCLNCIGIPQGATAVHSRVKGTGWCAEPCLRALSDHALKYLCPISLCRAACLQRLPAPLQAPKVAMPQPLLALNLQVLACRALLRLGAKQCSPMRRRGLRQSRHSRSRGQMYRGPSLHPE